MLPPSDMPPFPCQTRHTVCSAPPDAEIIHLDFSELPEFVAVDDQYQPLGIEFEGAIAIQPSNTAFGASPQDKVLIPGADRSSIAVKFLSMTQIVGAWVTATQQIKLTLFDQQNHLIAEQQAGSPHYVQSSLASPVSFAQHQLEIFAEDVARAEFSSEAPFVLHSFFWANRG